MIDGHAHLDAVNDIESVLRRAQEAGIDRIVGVGMDRDSNRRILALSDTYPQIVLPALGYHPWNIREDQMDMNIDYISQRLKNCIALGEVGLDYKVKVPKKLQWRVFEDLLSLAARDERPVIVHSRFSHGRCLEMVLSAGIKSAVFHWYSGPAEVLAKLLAAGYYVSATPALAFSRAHRDRIAEAPLERVLIETDSPVAYNGQVSEPVFLLRTIDALSRLKNMPRSEIAQATTENAVQFFGLEKFGVRQ